jgi:glycosyltransferase involved in cell wall biosynthesis
MGLENLLRAVALLHTQGRRVFLVVGGKGPLAASLAALSADLSIADYVRFAGFIPEADLPAYYQAADLFVLPTLDLEGFGLITLEALACGTPVVGTPVGSTAELLGDFDARWLATGTDPRAIAAAAARGLELAEDGGAELRRRCRAFAERYDWERIVDQYECLYAEAVQHARA